MRSLLLVGFFLLCQGSSAFENCDNGGFLFKNKSCNCPNYWQNDPNADNGCTEIQCVNGGYSSPSSPTAPQRCVCPSGYLGIHCEAVTTFIPHSNLYKQSSSSSFTLVYVNLFSNYYGGLVYSQFQNALDRIIGGTNFAKKWLITNSDTPNLNPNSISDSSHYNFTTERFDEAISLGAPMSPVQFSCYGAPFFQPIVEHIMENGIRETAITILTQHPASNDLDPYSVPWYDRLIMLCQSFDIRINVVFSDDQTFVRCTSDDTNKLRELSEMTGGIFVTAAHNPDYTATGTIIDMVLTSHIAYEPIIMSTNGAVNFNMNIPPDFKKYYIVAYGDNQPPALINNSNCQVMDSIPMKSDDNVYAYPISFNPSCTISFTNTKRVQVFGSNMTLGPVSVKLYKSYLETSDLDTSKIQPVQGNVHKVSIHVENTGSLGAPTVTEAFFNQGGSSSRLTMTTRNGAMEYISNENITCDPSVYPAWIQLTLTGMPAAEKRYIPVFCQNWTSLLSKLDGSNPAGNNAEEETYWSSGERIDDDVTAPTTAVPASVFTQKTFVLGYSDKTTQDQQNSFLLGSVLQSPFYPYTDFGEIRFDINGELDYHEQSTFGAFADNVYGSYGWNSSIAITQPTSQVMIALNKLANSELIKQNSLITMNLARVVDPTDPLSKISTVYPLVNRNTKVVMFIDKSALDKQNDINNILSPVLLNQVAAVTSGHFIVCNENDNNGFKSLLRTVFTQGPGQNLLLAKNFAGVTSRGKVGTLYLSGKGPDNINVTITFSTYVASNDGSAATSSILAPTFNFIHGNNTLSQTTLIQTLGSNFYTATVTLPGGYDVQVMLGSNLLYTQPSLLRIWTPSVTNDDVQITYKDLLYINKEHGGGPDDFNGAIPVVSLYNSNTNDTSMLNVTYLDCAGNYIDLYDGQQNLSMKDSATNLKYVPYFCTATSSSCITGTENLYYSQYRSNTGFVATKAFVCVQDARSTADGCNNQDTRGNYLCGGSDSPYRRGRAGLLIDCSDPYNSLLSYDDSVPATYPGLAPFKCNCGGDPDQGPSCENSDCTRTNTDGGAVDTFYRTYSIVVAYSPQTRIQSDIKILFTDASKLLVPTSSVENIWQYQLFAACPNGDMTTLFIGTDFGLFQKSFVNVTQQCSEGNATDYDLTNVYGRVVSSVGKQQRGLIVFYHEMDDATTQKVTVADTDAFISQAQQYQQQMYVFNVFDSGFMPPSPITSELISALMSTGGNVVLGDYQKYDVATKLTIKFFTSILTASVSLNSLEPITTTIDTVIETNSYIIATRLDNSDYTFPKDQFDTICKTANDKNAEGYGAVCFVSSGTRITLTPSLTRNVSYSVVAIGDSSPLGIFITQRKDDRQTSVPVDYTTGGPTLAIYSPSSYETQNNLNKNARDANRKSSCTFVRSTVDVFGQLKAGFNSIKMTTQFNSNSVTKVYPFGVSSQISCQNGASVNIGYGQCICEKFWDGPDCSRPRCGPGTLSTWSNACNCPPTFTGRFCDKDLDPVTTQAPSTTVTSATAQSSAVSSTDASTIAQSSTEAN